MTRFKVEYAGAATTLISGTTFNAFASSSTVGKQSPDTSNTTDLYVDSLVICRFSMSTGGTAANDKAIYVYAYAVIDGQRTGMPPAGSTEGAYTFGDANYTTLHQLGMIPVTAANTTVVRAFSLAAAFDNVMPPAWGIVTKNYCGIATTSDNTSSWIKYQGVYYQGV